MQVLRYGLVILALLAGGFPASAKEGTLDIDYTAAPVVAVEADKVPADRILRELGERLGFAIGWSGTPDGGPLVSGKFRGKVDDILPRMLRSSDYMIVYGSKSSIERVVLTAGKGGASTANNDPNPKRPVTAAPAAPVPTPAPALPAPPPPPAAAAASPTPTAAAAPPAATPPGESGTVTDLLTQRAQSTMARPVLPDQPTADTKALGRQTDMPTQTYADPSQDPDIQRTLAITTQQSQQNLQALLDALKKACIGDQCAK